MYELLIKLYYELEYKRYTIEDLKEIKEILESLNGKVEEVKLKKVKGKWLNGLYYNGINSRCFRILFLSRFYMF